jgi:GH24 family phage-related lysozyme (muramidase)
VGVPASRDLNPVVLIAAQDEREIGTGVDDHVEDALVVDPHSRFVAFVAHLVGACRRDQASTTSLLSAPFWPFEHGARSDDMSSRDRQRRCGQEFVPQASARAASVRVTHPVLAPRADPSIGSRLLLARGDPMHAAAQSAWYRFIRRHEGEVAFMYLDTKGLVTIGIGNLIDPVSLALTLPFQFKANNRIKAPGGRAATRAEIETEWKALKTHQRRQQLMTGGHRLCEPETDLELNDANRLQLFDDKSSANERQLRGHFNDFDWWPADAQLGLMAMAWGLGAGFPSRWSKFSAACKKKDFDAAAADSKISTWNADRNDASTRLFTNAGRVLANPDHYTATTLYYPRVLLDAINVTA